MCNVAALETEGSHQLNVIFDLLGTPSTEQIQSMGAAGCSVPGAYTEVLVKYCRSYPRAERLLHRE